MRDAPEPGRRGSGPGRRSGDPVRPVRPPRPGVLVRPGKPLLRIQNRRAPGPVHRLGVARRVDQALDVPGVAEHERARPAEQLRGAVARRPRRQVVGHPAGDVTGQGDRAQIHRGAQAGQPAGRGHRVVLEDVQELGVQRGRQVGPVGVPGQHVERRRLLAHQVVVDPRLPHQVVAPTPREPPSDVTCGLPPVIFLKSNSSLKAQPDLASPAYIPLVS